ncbi:carboxypeptidase M32 [Abyssisolibacter fermentans]|uniref:carboxypeptidase M32 n=1 Tax=Abyssisolibacter fermentans TaxID=1766203 RepID=UPI00082E268F
MSLDQIKEQFNDLLKKKQALSYAQSMIYWDAVTGAPKKGMEARAKHLGVLSGETHKLLTSKEMVECIKILEENKDKLDNITVLSLKLIKKDYNQVCNIPKKEYEEYSELTSIANDKWEEAMGKSDFALFQPYLEKVIEYKKRFVEYRGYEVNPYNVLLDDHEPGMTVEILDEFFKLLREKIVPLVKNIENSPKKIRSDFTIRKFDLSKQKEFSEYLLDILSYDFDAGMFKESVHPFTLGLNPYDVRITSHFHERLFLSAIYSTIHECGHALYEQDIDKDLVGTIAATGVSMGIHESQSRAYENIIGRNINFLKFIYPKLKEMFPEQLEDVSLQEFYEAVNESKPSLIRTEADELTYSLHIMVRYEIEKMLFNDEIQVKDLPQVWNQKMQEYLGIVPQNDAEGVLQDVHWSDGLIGYFPSYALGNAYASQFIDSMKKDIDLDEILLKGKLEEIKNWLTDKIHKYGSTKMPNEILKNVTGEELNPKYFIDYLEDKYSKLYNLK